MSFVNLTLLKVADKKGRTEHKQFYLNEDFFGLLSYSANIVHIVCSKYSFYAYYVCNMFMNASYGTEFMPKVHFGIDFL